MIQINEYSLILRNKAVFSVGKPFIEIKTKRKKNSAKKLIYREQATLFMDRQMF